MENGSWDSCVGSLEEVSVLRTQLMIILIVASVFLLGVAVVVGSIWWLGAGLGTVVVAAALILFALLFIGVLRPWYSRWGATDEEVAMPMAGDDLIPDAPSVTRAIGISAAPADVWPWLVQLGLGRLAGTATTG